ncbi:hypothetical protein NX059_004035 [Plenodomus lindquistii]|nr:hypothetical protein NX059_004035 [Plenodomus lindquistii]
MAADSKVDSFVQSYIQRHIAIAAPDWYLNPSFRIVLASDDGARIRAAVPLQYASGLSEVLESSEPPSPDFFETTPHPDGKFWGVYAMLMVKDGSEPGLCIGSGTDSLQGYKTRTKMYHDKKHVLLPRAVRAFYDNGYDLAHIGLLCWAPIPRASIRPRARLQIMALEGAFTNIFLSAIPTIMDSTWSSLAPWSRDDVLWKPLNSHTPFNEGVAGLELSPDELEQQEAERKLRAKEHSKKAYAKNSQVMREQYDRERAQDIVAFRLKKSIQAKSWVSRNKSKVSAINRRSKTKALATQRFYCNACLKGFPDSSKLKRHNETDKHKDKVADKPLSLGALKYKKEKARVAAKKTHFCKACDQNFDGPKHLADHKLTSKHLKNSRASVPS